MAAEKFVFPDIANGGNIIVQKKNGQITYRAIDSDDVAFDDYYCTGFSRKMSGELLADGKYALGVNKCFDDNTREYLYPNKQLDIRSLYALLYLIMCNNSKRLGNKDSFYPFTRPKDEEEYQEFLDDLNIPQGSSLYQKTLTTLSDEEPNIPIEDSLLELAELGYEFDKQDNRYCLKKNRWYIQ